MGFFNSGFFWFIEGILAVVVVLGLNTYLKDKGIPTPWWKWVVLAIWVLIAGITIAFVGTSIGENEMVAATKGGIIFGAISVVLGVGVWRILVGRKKTS